MDIEDVRALARSSRVLWSTLCFTWSIGVEAPRRAFVRRPDAVRVDTLDGAVVTAERQPPPATSVGGWVVVDGPDGPRTIPAARYRGPVASALMILDEGGRRGWPGPTREEALAAVAADPPVLRPDGLVAVLPGSRWDDTVPFFENYHWVAMLDPVELADGVIDIDGAATPPGAYADLREVGHHGRPALEVTITPDERYDPRCGCCPLLDGVEAVTAEEASYGGPLPGFVDDPAARPDATRFRVRIDRESGLCVFVEPLDGTHRDVLDVNIELVDEPLDDDIFRVRHG